MRLNHMCSAKVQAVVRYCGCAASFRLYQKIALLVCLHIISGS